ncbi:hypothetical protein JCM11641_001114 [Rhodosporidiobolus odoratus]
MALELDWSSLDADLTLSTTRALTSAFANAPRPDFLGPLTVTTFSFGDQQPSLELTDIRDVYREFLLADEDDDDAFQPPPPPTPQTRLPPVAKEPSDSDVFETRSLSGSLAGRPFPFSPTASISQLQQPPSASLFSPGLLHHSFPSPSPLNRSRSHSPAGPLPAAPSHSHSQTRPHSYTPPSPTPSQISLPPEPVSSAPSPSLQAHLKLTYSGNLALGISTSLLINYPSPGFMSLPLSLTLTSLAFEGTLVVAYEGGRRRVHLSLLDPGPAEGGGETKLPPGVKETPGLRLLRSAVVESEVGNADRHVLRNVGKVEKFVLEVARKTIENELVFP